MAVFVPGQAVAKPRSNFWMLLALNQKTSEHVESRAGPEVDPWGIEPQSVFRVSTYEADRRARAGNDFLASTTPCTRPNGEALDHSRSVNP